ncbi:MAG TPA: transcriptional regulator [Chthoniobacteraceae bacterium]
MDSLSPVQQKFILHWGEMGARWGINRTVAQIHALLYITGEALPADDIVRLLDVARSHVSTSMRELQGWGIVRVVHRLGDRRDHFESMQDVWEMFRVILEERRKREIEPTLALLRECRDEADREKGGDPTTRRRLAEMLDFFEKTDGWYEKMRRIPTKVAVQILEQGDKILKLFVRK